METCPTLDFVAHKRGTINHRGPRKRKAAVRAFFGCAPIICILLASLVGASFADDAEKSPLSARRAFGYLVKVCRIGPRISGTHGMARQQRLIVEHFPKFGARVSFQPFDVAHPQTGRPVRMNNMIVSWHPERAERILLACHYDTRPYPDRDLFNRRGTFIGANDGASGVALFMEMAHHMQALEPKYGVDFVFFDGEELVYRRGDKYFLGSEFFARDYIANPPAHRYVYGVVVDMIADRNLNLYQEKKSLHYAPEVTRSLWETADRLGIDEFIARRKHDVEDDHVPLNEIARIPTCDIIDFDYPHWHKTKDLPSACSGDSIIKVARVLLHWLEHPPTPPRVNPR